MKISSPMMPTTKKNARIASHSEAVRDCRTCERKMMQMGRVMSGGGRMSQRRYRL
ncbi:MAG TPA: hypothetical protein VFV54_07655 [Thermoanaerobaculia bacterium]|nr:hypothetical protein [Thermoanaerobaculia bacterium]